MSLLHGIDGVDKPIALGADEDAREIVSNRWLWILGLTGCLLVALAVVLDTEFPRTDDIWTDIALQFGSTILLFAVLFYVERRFVRRVIQQAAKQFLRAMSPDEPISDDVLDNPNTRIGSAAADAAAAWYSAISEGRFSDAWARSERNWRLCRAQAWIWNHRSQLGLTDQSQMQNLAGELSAVACSHTVSQHFMASERAQFLEATSGTPPGRWGLASSRRCVGPGYEVFIFIALTEDYAYGMEILGPSLVPGSHTVLMHLIEGGWQMAAFDAVAPPQPGWPPAWWIKGDRVAELATDLMEANLQGN